MKTLAGIGVSSGTAVATAYVFDAGGYEIPGPSDSPEAGAAALRAVLERTAAALAADAELASGAARDILRAQAAMAADATLFRRGEARIRAGVHPAQAILDAGAELADQLGATGNEYLAARAADIRAICDSTARALVGAPPRRPPAPDRSCVLVATDLTPADTATLDTTVVKAIVTERGAATSHTAVIARARDIPAVVGVKRLLQAVPDGEVLAVDGGTGVVMLGPDEPTRRRFELAAQAEARQRLRVHEAAGVGPTRLADGTAIEVAANISAVAELPAAVAAGAQGVGLLRTELLYQGKSRPPTQAEMELELTAIRTAIGDRRLVVRTFDIGSDKPVPFLPVRREPNPELGLRGLRLARVHPDLLDTQLRAVAAVAGAGPIAVMAPMVSTVAEARWFAARAAECGMPAGAEIGVMVEVPALAICAEMLAPHVDFLSVGTNDLTQYLFAADRRDSDLVDLQDPYAPAVLRVVDMICRGAAGEAWVGVCGEAASDPGWAALAVGLGVTELSMSAPGIERVRAALAHVTLPACRDAAGAALLADDASQVRAIAGELLKEWS
jgi:phosphotransferase system enzyme I (PtsI)